jgi:hypothetical protein
MPPSLRPLAAVLSAAALAACGERLRPCEIPPIDVSVWETVSPPRATLRLPSGYAQDTAAAPAGGEAGSDAMAWSLGPAADGIPAARIVFQRAAEVPAVPAPDEGPQLPGFARCTLGEGERRAVVTLGWMADTLSATGRSFHTSAVWPDRDGREAGLYLVAETPQEQQRQLAAAASLRLR